MQKPKFVLSVLTVSMSMMLNTDLAVAVEQEQTLAQSVVIAQTPIGNQTQPPAQTPAQEQMQGQAQEQVKGRQEKPVDFEKCPIVGCQDQTKTRQETQTQTQSREQIYGSQLMTRRERAEYRAKMRSLKTTEEREAFRMEHHQKMQERAKEMGKTLPGMPPAQGGGMGGGRGR